MSLRNLLAAAAVALASGCASTPFGGPPTFVAQPAAGQELRENRHAGGFALESVKASSVARVQQMLGDNLEEHGALFQVVVANLGSRPVTFGLDSIEATSGGNAGAVITRPQLVELEDAKKQSGSALGSLMSAGAVIGGLLATTATAIAGQGQLTQSQIDSSSQSIAAGMVGTMEASHKVDEAHRTASDARLELFDLIGVETGELAPGETAGGHFIVRTSAFSTEPTLIKVRVGEDEHLFLFKQKLF